MIVIDMLHAAGDSILESSPIWEELHKNRSRFYSKNLVGYLGYIRKQVAVYSNKGNRLNAINDVLNVIYSATSSFGTDMKMKGIWDKLPVNEYCSEVINPIEKRWRFYQVCGKQLSENITLKEAAFILGNLSKSYGSRANKAMANGGIDWKAVSHAFRAGFQLREIYTTGDLIYPLRDCDFIRDVKMGNMNYENDGIGQKLEDILSEIEQLSKNSSFPDSIDKDWMNNFLVSQYS